MQEKNDYEKELQMKELRIMVRDQKGEIGGLEKKI